jgi:hypothetical protein
MFLLGSNLVLHPNAQTLLNPYPRYNKKTNANKKRKPARKGAKEANKIPFSGSNIRFKERIAF